MHNEKIKDKNEKKFLIEQYPTLFHNGEKVKYNPERHTMEKGEAAFFYNVRRDKIGKGIIKKVCLSRTGSDTYLIKNSRHLKHKVWPNIEGQKIIDAAVKEALNNLSPQDKDIVGL